ncbi:MAG: AbrB/MazE/SpoVT family DNA-binding domain-containing protein [Candidatus Bathyarchaeia archaeon]
MTAEVTFKKVKVSDKGQISIPVDMQKLIGLKKGDELLLIRKGRKIILEKPDRIMQALEDEFEDVRSVTERQLAKLWLRREENVWNRYLKGKTK